MDYIHWSGWKTPQYTTTLCKGMVCFPEAFVKFIVGSNKSPRSDTKVFGKPWVKHLRETSMTSDIEEFKEVLGEIGKIQGWTLDDLKSTFSTRLLDELIFGD